MQLEAEAPVGQAVRIRLILRPDWAGVVDALGGGPALVRKGVAVFHANEVIPDEPLVLRQPRAAVGQRADGSLVLVTVDGGSPATAPG